jgi:hypothetical protein
MRIGSGRRIRTFGRGSKVLCLTSWPSRIEHQHTSAEGPAGWFPPRDLRVGGGVWSCDEECSAGGAGFGDSCVWRLSLPGRYDCRHGNRERRRRRRPMLTRRTGGSTVRGQAGSRAGDRLRKRGGQGEGHDGLDRPLHDDARSGDLECSPCHVHARCQRPSASGGAFRFDRDRKLRPRLRNPSPGPGPGPSPSSAAIARVLLSPTRHPHPPEGPTRRGVANVLSEVGLVNPACKGRPAKGPG